MTFVRSGIARAFGLALAATLASASAGPSNAVAAVADSRASGQPAAADLRLLNLMIDVDYAYTSIMDHFYVPVNRTKLLEGARRGIEGYLRARGVAHPAVAPMTPHPDGRFDVPQIEQRIGVAITNYGRRIDARELIYATLRGELASLDDPYAMFFTKEQLADFSRALGGETFGGIGVEIAVDTANNRWRIDRVFPGGPAEKAGLQPGDEIAAIDGAPVDSGHEDATRARLRGKVGTQVSLTITRMGAPLPAPVAVTRAVVAPPETDARMLANNIGYLSLSAFGEHSADEVRAGMQRLQGQGMRAFIFDLRDDGGGYEAQAVRIASFFVPAGPVIYTQTYGKKRVATNADGSLRLPQVPTAVLVNGDSASGAELVAGALHDRANATLVGTKTFGKGVVQELFHLPDDAALKVTTSRYFTAGGHDIDRRGLLPDIVVEQPHDAAKGVPGRDPQLDRAIALLSPAPEASPSPAP